MELDCVLLGLIRLHQGATGYELNRIMKESTGRLLSTSLSQIYPALKRLHERGQVSYTLEPLKNRPDKKIYQVTPAGEQTLQDWLAAPIQSGLDFEAFTLRMAFAPLMPKAVILGHIDREIAYRAGMVHQHKPGIQVEVDYLDKEKFNRPRAELLWDGLYQVQLQTEVLRIAWLKEWRKQVEENLKD